MGLGRVKGMGIKNQGIMRIFVFLLVAFSIVGIEIEANAAEGKDGDQVVGCVAEHGRARLLTSTQALAIGAGSAATFLGGATVYFIQSSKLRNLAVLEAEIRELLVHRGEMAALNRLSASRTAADPVAYSLASSGIKYLNHVNTTVERGLIAEILRNAKISGFHLVSSQDLSLEGAGMAIEGIREKIVQSRVSLNRLTLGSKIVGAASLGGGIVSVLASQQYGDKLDEEQEQFRKALAPQRTEKAIFALYQCSQQLALNDQANKGGGR